FVDITLQPYDDQWAFLSSVKQLTRDDVETLIRMAAPTGDIVGIRRSEAECGEEGGPWNLPSGGSSGLAPISESLPARLSIQRGNIILVEKAGLPPAFIDRLIRLAAFQNPEFYNAQAMRLSTFGKPRVIACAEDLPTHIGLPRGMLDELLQLLESHGIAAEISDHRFAGVPLRAQFNGELRPPQKQAARMLAVFDDGVLCAPTAFGKTAVAAYLIAQRKVNTLVLVHRRQLMDQWRERLAGFLGLNVKDIGQIGGGKASRTKNIDIAVMQSLVRNGEVKDL